MEYRINTPLNDEIVHKLKAGDKVYITGYIYTGRDAAHKKMIETIESGQKLPFELAEQVLYYVGTCPAKPGFAVGSAGPTTSGRMDKFTPALIDLGLKGMIGKGQRSQSVIDSMKKNNAVYFGAIGGAAVLISQCIKSEEVIAYPELGTEAIKKLYIEDMPVIVLIDKNGNNLYDTEWVKYQNMYEEE